MCIVYYIYKILCMCLKYSICFQQVRKIHIGTIKNLYSNGQRRVVVQFIYVCIVYFVCFSPDIVYSYENIREAVKVYKGQYIIYIIYYIHIRRCTMHCSVLLLLVYFFFYVFQSNVVCSLLYVEKNRPTNRTSNNIISNIILPSIIQSILCSK